MMFVSWLAQSLSPASVDVYLAAVRSYHIDWGYSDPTQNKPKLRRVTINYRIRLDLNDIDIEILTIEIFKNKNRPFLITTWYRPPNDPMDTLYKFENCLR